MEVEYDITNKFCKVFIRDGKHFLKTPNGEEIHGIVETIVKDGIDEIPTCIVTLLVSLDN